MFGNSFLYTLPPSLCIIDGLCVSSLVEGKAHHCDILVVPYSRLQIVFIFNHIVLVLVGLG